MTKIGYGVLEGDPVRYTETEAWLFAQRSRTWHKINPADVLFNAAVTNEASFTKTYGMLPPLPSNAFQDDVWSRAAQTKREPR